MPVIPLECPSCGTELRIDSDESAAICAYCGRPFVVNEAIVLNYIKIVTAMEDDAGNALICEQFEIEDDILKRYNGSSDLVVVPDNVTVIGSKAFEDRRELTEIRIPDSVKVIEDNAFSGCDNLKTVCFPDSLKKIGNYAFYECTGLERIELPFSIEEIGQYAFSGCFMLNSVKMPSSRSKVHETAFMGNKDARFDWPDDWAKKQLDKLKIVAPVLGGLISLYDSTAPKDTARVTLLYLGISGVGVGVDPVRYNFYAYNDFMRLFSIGANNNDPYLLRVSVEGAQQSYDSVSDIQRSYSELICLLDRAHISRSKVETINIPHFIWKQGKRLNDYKVADIGAVPVLQISLVQE